MKKRDILVILSVILFVGFLFNISSTRAAILYYNDSTDTVVDGDWNTLSNWWTDSGFTTNSLSLPAVGDDVIITENVSTNSGSAASVNTMTANGSVYTNIPVTVASSATFNDTSYNSDAISGDATFNDSSYNSGTVSGNAIFNYASGGTITLTGSQVWGTVGGTIKGSDAVLITEFIFNNSSASNGSIPGNATFNGSSFNQGTVSGDAFFNNLSYNAGAVSGNAVFNYASGGTITLTGSQVWGTVGGTIKGSDAVLITTFIFNDSSRNNATFSGNPTFNDSSTNFGNVIGNPIFNDSSSNSSTVTGNATFNNSSLTGIGSTTTNATFNDSSINDGNVSSNAIFNGSAINALGVVYNATFNNVSINARIVLNNAIFNDASANWNSIFNDASFFDSSSNSSFGTVTGDACFATTATNLGSVGGTTTVCPISIPTVTTDPATILSTSSANLFGEITDTGGESVTPIGFQYGRTTSYGTTISQVGPFVRGTFNNIVSSLACGNYHFRAFATNTFGTGNGVDLSFTPSSCGGGVTQPSVFISANPTTVNPNASSTITWTSANATSCAGSGGDPGWPGDKDTSGSFSTGVLTNPTTFSISCSGQAGTIPAVASATVNIGPAQNNPTVNLTANPSTIQSGQSSTLTWTSVNANSCSASWIGSNATSGSQAVTPSSTTTYNIICTNSTGQSASVSATVNVGPVQNNPTASLSANPSNIQSGQSSTLSWSSTNATSCSSSWSGSNLTSGSQTVSPVRTTTYNVICTNSTGQSASASSTVSVRQVQVTTCQDSNATNYGGPLPCVYRRIDPTVSISASPTTVNPNASSNITWTSTNAISCTGSGGDTGWAGPKATSGSFSTGALANSTTFNISCSGQTGTIPANASVAVDVEQPLPILCQDAKANNYGGPLPCAYPVIGAVLGSVRTFTNKPSVRAITNVATLIPAATSVVVLAAALLTGVPLANYLFYIFVIFSQILGFTKKPKPWGTVYDSYTKKPLPFARVEILNEQSRKLQSTVTDANGRYGFLIPSQLSNIQLQAHLAKYDFPSKEQPSIIEQKLYPSIYKGGFVNALSTLTNFDLPMDPRDKSTAHSFYFGISSIKLNNILTKFADVLFVLGTILGITNAVVNPSAFSYSILVVILLSFLLRTSGLKLKSFGLTKDIETNKTLPFGLITLNNQGGERLNFTVSDDQGRYFLLTPKGNYLLKAYTPSHISPTRTKEMPVSTRAGWISREIGV